MEKFEFINLMLKSRRLSLNDKRRVLVLATRELEKNDTDSDKPTDPPSDPKNHVVHSPKDTAAFLALFNQDKGFKFLTHEYVSETGPAYEDFLKATREVFKNVTKNKYHIPSALYSFMEVVLTGKNKGADKEWIDYRGQSHKENFACSEWLKWAKKNPGLHLIRNESFKKTIMALRSTVRTVECSDEGIDSRLNAIIPLLAAKHKNLHFEYSGLENADFYTYVFAVKNSLRRILKDIAQHNSAEQKVKITYQNSPGSDFSQCIIKIIQPGSFSPNSIKTVINKFKGGGGAFSEIAESLRGYCNWSVESKWEGEAWRWNILDDTGREQTEQIEPNQAEGFTHILTFYKKLS